MMIDMTLINALKQQHKGRIRACELDGETIALREPTRAEYKRFRSELTDESRRDTAIENLITTLIVSHDDDKKELLFERFPALGEILGKEIQDMVGFRDVEIKKF